MSKTWDRPPAPEGDAPVIGVVIVTYHSSDVIEECLESLSASQGVALRIVVVDNASEDDTCDVVRGWASGERPFNSPRGSPAPRSEPVAKPLALVEIDAPGEGRELGPLTLIHVGSNRGFAGGVNVGLKALQGQADFYWVLNPDCVVLETTAAAYADLAARSPGFGLMTGKTAYYTHPELLQTTGGRVSRLTGVCVQRDYQASIASAATGASGLDWVTGANLVASPALLNHAGLMEEDYFLYYEEVDWAFRRGNLPIVFNPSALVYHHGGTTIGSGAVSRRPSPFSEYFNHRNRIRFARRFLGRFPVGAYAYGLAKAVQLLLLRHFAEAQAIICGMFELSPPRSITRRFKDPKVLELAFGRTTASSRPT